MLEQISFGDHALSFADDSFFSRMPFLCLTTDDADWALQSVDPGAFP